MVVQNVYYMCVHCRCAVFMFSSSILTKKCKNEKQMLEISEKKLKGGERMIDGKAVEAGQEVVRSKIENAKHNKSGATNTIREFGEFKVGFIRNAGGATSGEARYVYGDMISIVVGGRRSISEREAEGGSYRCRTAESERVSE